MLESKLQRDVQEYARSKGMFPIKLHGNSYQMAGLPDLLIVIPNGHVLDGACYVWIETKLPGEKLRPNQEKVIEIMRGMGAEVHVCETVKQAKEVLGGKGT